MLGRLLALVGALGAVMRGLTPRAYDFLSIRGGAAYTYMLRYSPFWEAFGHPFDQIIKYAVPTAAQGFLTIAFPPEFWAIPNCMENLLEATANKRQTGAMQIEFGDKPDAILRKRMGVCTCFTWNWHREHYETKGIVKSFEYAPARPPPGAHAKTVPLEPMGQHTGS